MIDLKKTIRNMAREKEIILDNKELNENWQYQKVLILLFFFFVV